MLSNGHEDLTPATAGESSAAFPSRDFGQDPALADRPPDLQIPRHTGAAQGSPLAPRGAAHPRKRPPVPLGARAPAGRTS